MDNFKVLQDFIKAGKALVDALPAVPDEPTAEDAFWDRLIQVCGLDKRATKAEVIDYVKEVKLGHGYGTLAVEELQEKLNKKEEERLKLVHAHSEVSRNLRTLKTEVEDLLRVFNYKVNVYRDNTVDFINDMEEITGRY